MIAVSFFSLLKLWDRCVLGDDVAIWELTVSEEYAHTDNIAHPCQLDMLRNEFRRTLGMIGKYYANRESLHIFPAVSNASAVEIGRARLSKADMPWIIYEQSKLESRFIDALRINRE